MSQFHQQSDDDQYPQYPQFDFPSPTINQQPAEDFVPEGYTPATGQQSVQGFVSGGGYASAVNQQPAGDFAPEGYTPATSQRSAEGFEQERSSPATSQRLKRGFTLPHRKLSLTQGQQSTEGFALTRRNYSSVANAQPVGSFAPAQEEYATIANAQPMGSFAPTQEEYATIVNQQPMGVPAPAQEEYSPLVNQGSMAAPAQEEYATIVNQQPMESFALTQEEYATVVSQQLSEDVVPTGYPSAANYEPEGGFVPSQGGYSPLVRRPMAGGSVSGNRRYSGNQQAGSVSVTNAVQLFLKKLKFQQLLKNFSVKRDSEQVSSIVAGSRTFGVTIAAIAMAIIGGLNLFIMLMSLGTLSIVSSMIGTLASTPYTSALAAQVSAAMGLNILILVIFYYTALGIGHLYIAHGLWQLKSWAYWSAMGIEGLTIFIQLIVLLMNHNGGAFFANVYISVLIIGYLLVAADARRAFRISFWR